MGSCKSNLEPALKEMKEYIAVWGNKTVVNEDIMSKVKTHNFKAIGQGESKTKTQFKH